MKIEIKWKKATDEGYPRIRVVEVETPVTRDTSALEDALLGMPGQGDSQRHMTSTGCVCVYIQPCIEEPLEAAPTDERCIQAMAAAVISAGVELGEAEELHAREVQERQQKELQQAREYIAGGDYSYIGCSRTPSADDILKLDPDLGEQVQAERDRREEDERVLAAQRVRQAEAEEAQAELDTQARGQERGAWIALHGSNELKRQVEAGLDGWPRYLHERLEHELPGWELDNNGDDGDVVIDPSDDTVRTMLHAADHLVELGLVDEPKDALGCMVVQEIRLPDEQDWTVYLVCKNIYRPGRHPAWAVKNIRIPV